MTLGQRVTGKLVTGKLVTGKLVTRKICHNLTKVTDKSLRIKNRQKRDVYANKLF